MLPTITRRAAQQKAAEGIPYIYTNPYKAKRLWPPDFTKISQKHQFRLERRFRRRSKLKWARPRWTKAVKMVQFGTVVFIAVYGVLFLDWNTQGTQHRPFEGVRNWFFGLTGNIWGRDHIQQRGKPDEASPVSTPSS